MFKKQDISVQGTVSEGFDLVRKEFEVNFINGDELSAQLCVVHKGKIVRSSTVRIKLLG